MPRALATVALEGSPVNWQLKPLTSASGAKIVIAETDDDALGIIAATPAELIRFSDSLREAVQAYQAVQEIIERDPIG